MTRINLAAFAGNAVATDHLLRRPGCGRDRIRASFPSKRCNMLRSIYGPAVAVLWNRCSGQEFAGQRRVVQSGKRPDGVRGVQLILILLCVTAASTLPAAEVSETLLLAEGGKSLLPVVVSKQASGATKAVAAELGEYLQKMTGATFPVVTGSGSSGIVLGTLAEFPDPALAEPLAIRSGFDGKEAYAIRTEPNRIRLIGATEQGASHAAFALLEALGCRWFYPAPEWEVVPSTPTLRVMVNETERPALLGRRIWYGYGLFPEPGQPRDHSRSMRDYAAWGRHNRMGQSFTIHCGHVWQSIIAENKPVFDQHPEYLAMVDGRRHGPQLCVSNPEVRQLAARWALNYLEKNPGADMVSMEPSDGGGQCECEACAELGSISERVFGLANDVARAVAEKQPGKLVGLYAYNEHCEPPGFDLEPNVYVQITAGFIRGRYRFDELIELWPRRCQSLGIYEYFSVWLWDFDRLPGGRAADIAYLKKQIPRYVQAGATSLDCESGNNWGPHGRGYYIANRLMWDPQADVEALLADFYAKAFGPAAVPMRRYYERFDPSNEPLMSGHLLGLGFRDVEEASRLAAGQPAVQARLDHIKQYLRYVHLRWLVDRATEKEEQKRLTLAALTHAYRTRYSYMNHWEAMRQGWIPQAAKAFDEPSWLSNDRVSDPPWAVDEPYTHEETEAAFREGLQHFQPETLAEQQFSGDLVPVVFASRAGAIESKQAYQGGLRYALYSAGGEPLSLQVVPGTIAWYRDRAAAKWNVSDGTGTRIAGGSLPLDGETHAIEVNVPAAGLYYFQFDDSRAGWKIHVAAERIATIELVRADGFAHAGWMQPMYFYVPKGTDELQYFWSGGPHRVHGPDGTKLKEVETSGAIVRVRVPEGADGRPWHFTRMALGHLWFFNAPNYLAASPAALLIPKELAARDGLLPLQMP